MRKIKVKRLKKELTAKPQQEPAGWEEELIKLYGDSIGYIDLDKLYFFIKGKIHQAREEGYKEGLNKKIDYDKEGWQEEIDEAREEVKSQLIKEIEKAKVKELFVGETQYRFYKGDIGWVYNQALDDIITLLKT